MSLSVFQLLSASPTSGLSREQWEQLLLDPHMSSEFLTVAREELEKQRRTASMEKGQCELALEKNRELRRLCNSLLILHTNRHISRTRPELSSSYLCLEAVTPLKQVVARIYDEADCKCVLICRGLQLSFDASETLCSHFSDLTFKLKAPCAVKVISVYARWKGLLDAREDVIKQPNLAIVLFESRFTSNLVKSWIAVHGHEPYTRSVTMTDADEDRVLYVHHAFSHRQVPVKVCTFSERPGAKTMFQ